MEIVIKTKMEGFIAANNSRLGTRLISFLDKYGNRLGFLTGEELNEQLKEDGFEIKQIKFGETNY